MGDYTMGGSPSIPKPAPIIIQAPMPPPVPVQRAEVATPDPEQDSAIAKQTKKRKSRSATVLTGGQGVANPLGADESLARPTATKLG